MDTTIIPYQSFYVLAEKKKKERNQWTTTIILKFCQKASFIISEKNEKNKLKLSKIGRFLREVEAIRFFLFIKPRERNFESEKHFIIAYQFTIIAQKWTLLRPTEQRHLSGPDC